MLSFNLIDDIPYWLIHLSVYHIQKLGMIADITSHNILLKSCCLAGKVELAQDTYKQIRELESKGQVKLDDFTYSTIIKV